MDKKIIFAVAGAGKTTYIVDRLSADKRSLIITYTDNNFDNLSSKILLKYGGTWPDNITLMTYFQFLYRFCYKPLLSDKVRAKGLIFKDNPEIYMRQNDPHYCITEGGYFYSNRLALFLDQKNVVYNVIARIEKYFDEFYIDEIQDIAGRDFKFLEEIMQAEVNMLFVGDFYQHTFNTSRDGNVNKNLFNDYDAYMDKFLTHGFIIDTTTLKNSWRCSKNICEFITNNLGIMIESNRSTDDNTSIEFVTDEDKVLEILEDPDIIKLHYQNGPKFGVGHKNWGETKGEDCYQDVCVVLNKTTFKNYSDGSLHDLKNGTKNKLYVAITRARGNCYMIKEQ